MSDYSIRTMTRAEVDLAVNWAAAEGWNPGLLDADCFYAADPGGFLLGLLDGEPIATISAVRYGGDFGFIGFYIVKPEHRGRGYGLRLWNAALDHLRGRNIGLDGVVAQQDNYRKSGFKLAYRNIRYQGSGGGEASEGADILPLAAFPFDEVCAYDRALFPAERSDFLRCWIAQPGATALGLRLNGRLAGYGMLRPCRTGYKIGPLFADGPEIAEALFTALRGHAEAGVPVFFDPPEVNPAAVALAEGQGMQVVFETARMYTRESPSLDLKRVFGVTSFELG